MALGPLNLSPLISGYIADKYGWRMNFWILTAFTAVALLLVIFAAPETTYKRPSIYETDISSSDNLPIAKETLTSGATATSQAPGSDVSTDSAAKESPSMEIHMNESPRSYWQELSPVRGLDTTHNPLVHLARLFICALYPAVIWSFLVGGTYVAWVSQYISPGTISIR